MTTDRQVASPKAAQHLRLHLTEGIGPIRFAALLKYFGSVDAVLSSSTASLQQVKRISPVLAEAIFRARSDDAAEREIERAAQLGIRIICLKDPDYPPPLARISDPPICLYVRGEFLEQDRASISVVGTRRCTRYGLEQARRFGALLAGAGFTVTSGLARGVDGQAHEGALQAGGRTIAVLGNGLADVYPPEHKDLAVRVAEHGAVVSEIPLDTAPDPKNFPRRNRIIVGLSAGLLVVEAGDRSGALISARLATEYNREIFAVPGRVDTPQAAGSNALIRDGGAKLVTSLEDILDELHAVERRVAPRPVGQPDLFSLDDGSGAADLSPDEQAVLAVFDSDEVGIDALTDASGLPVPRVTSALTTLQLKGQIVRLPGGRYTRRKRRAAADPADEGP